MGSFAAAVRTAWLTAFTGGAAYANPSVFVQLHIGDPTATGTNSPAANSQRMQATFGTPANGAVANSVAVTWVDVPATETYTHVSLWTLAIGGSVLGIDDLAAPIVATAGGSAAIGVGELALAVT